MGLIKQIMELLGTDAATAEKVLNEMQVDFSECTKAQFKHAAQDALLEVKPVATTVGENAAQQEALKRQIKRSRR